MSLFSDRGHPTRQIPPLPSLDFYLRESLEELMNTDHYVYLHKRKDNAEVFYIGNGRKKRATETRKRNKEWNAVVSEAGGFTIEYLQENLSKEEAIAVENRYLDNPLGHWKLVNIAPSRSVHDIDRDLISEYLEYDENSPSGLKWKSNSAANVRKSLIAGYKESTEYWSVRVRGKLYRAHRLVWVLVNGNLDKDLVINHIDNNRSNNRISNLEPATFANNSRKSVRNRNPLAAGINFQVVSNKYEYWIGYVHDIDSKRYSKSFNCKKYGYDEARKLAEQWRLDQLRILNEKGAEYNIE